MHRTHRRLAASAAATLAAAAVFAGTGVADSTPVGPLPKGPASTIQTQKGQLIAVALPKRGSGRVWRIARTFDAHVLRQVSEAYVGASVVLVFKAVGTGKATVSFALTLGERAKAYEARHFTVRVH